MISLIMNWNILLFICYYIENKACVWHVNSYITFTAESQYFPSLIIVENRVQVVDFVEVVMKVHVVCTCNKIYCFLCTSVIHLFELSVYSQLGVVRLDVKSFDKSIRFVNKSIRCQCKRSKDY